MKDETLDKIEELATYIVKHEDKTDKWLKELRNANPSQVRRVFVALLDHQMRQKEVVEKPLLSLREYARVLFSDGNSGWEIRDLLLISIYEQSAKLGKPIITDDEDELDISKSELVED